MSSSEAPALHRPASPKTSQDPRIGQIMTLLEELALGHLDARATPSNAEDELDAILVGLNMLAEEFAARHIARIDAEARLDDMLDVVLGLSALDFSKRAKQGERGDVFDGLAAGLNMLGEELQSTTVTRSYLASIVDSMGESLIVVQGDRTVRAVNRAACELIGLPEHEIVGRPITNFLADDPAMIQASITRVEQSRRRWFVDRTILAQGGEKIPVRISQQALVGPNGVASGVVGVLHDMRETRALIEQAEAARREAEHALAELKMTQAQLVQSGKLAVVGELAGGVAHEINNPMAAVLGLSQLCIEQLEMNARPSESDVRLIKGHLAKIVEGAKRCRTITQNLLAFSRRSSTEMTTVRVADVISATLDLLGGQLKSSKIKWTTSYADGLPNVFGNANQLQQVFTNLVVNAMHAMADGGELRVRCERAPDGSIAAIFEDTGVGIAPDVLPRIFEPFFTTKAVGKGTGLGLSLSWGIVHTHGGRIDVSSTVGKGTTFVVSLPSPPEPRAVQATPNAAPMERAR